MIKPKHSLVVFALVTLISASTFAGVRVLAQVDPSKDIYVGESFAYHIIIDGDNQPGQVDLGPLAKYNPRSAGNRDVSQTSISIINGRTSQNIVKRYVMSYLLTCNQPGPVELGPVKVTAGAKTYHTNMVSVNVLKPGTTDKLDMEVTLSEKQSYVGQPILMTVRFYFSTEVKDPQFNIPIFSSNSFYFENPDVLDKQAKEVDLGAGTTVLASQHRVNHNGTQSNLLILRKILIPKVSGRLRTKPVTVSTDVVVGQLRSRDRFFGDFFSAQKRYKRFMVTSKSHELTVLPLPEQGKPAEFYGLVGRYTISASATPTTGVYMGDPITITIKVGGSKYLKPVQWPDIEHLPALSANFKLPSQKASPAIQDGFKVFTQTIRPDNNHANVIPPILLAYFDPDTGGYRVVKTKPIELDLKPSKRLTAADIEGSDFTPVNKEVEAIKKGLSANYESPYVLENMSFSPVNALISPRYAVIWLTPLLLLIFSSAVKIVTSTTPEKIAAKRRRRACSKTVARLKKIASTDASQRNELTESIMKQYIGDRFDRMAGSLTADDCHDIIISATRDAEVADKYRQTVAHCEAARYSTTNAQIDSGYTGDVIALIRKVEKRAKR